MNLRFSIFRSYIKEKCTIVYRFHKNGFTLKPYVGLKKIKIVHKFSFRVKVVFCVNYVLGPNWFQRLWQSVDILRINAKSTHPTRQSAKHTCCSTFYPAKIWRPGWGAFILVQKICTGNKIRGIVCQLACNKGGFLPYMYLYTYMEYIVPTVVPFFEGD